MPDNLSIKIVAVNKVNNTTYKVDFKHYTGWNEDDEEEFEEGTAVIKLDGDNYYIESLSTKKIN